MIDKVYILNVESETERRELCYNALVRQGFPASKIEIFTAKHYADYQDKQQLCEAAVSEGFELFKNLLDTGHVNECYQTYLAQDWSYMAFYKHLLQTNENAILIHDDVAFGCTYTELMRAFEMLPRPENILFATLLTYIGERITEPNLFLNDKSPWRKQLLPTSLFWNDLAMFYTPKGCELLLEYFNKLCRIKLGWLLKCFDHKIIQALPDTYMLLISPTSENLKNIHNIQKQITIGTLKHPYEYSPATEMPCTQSTIHDRKTGKPIK